jgi:T5SS/PEP-CTERM-associated repeat protein
MRVTGFVEHLNQYQAATEIATMQWHFDLWPSAFPKASLRAWFLVVSGLFGLVSSVDAAIMSAGNLAPALPWGSTVIGYVGKISDGSLSVDAGSTLQSSDVYAAQANGVHGTATVSGSGSIWNSAGVLNFGYLGSGTLTVDAGGRVSNAGTSASSLGYASGASGVARISGAGSTWNNCGSLEIGVLGSGLLAVEASGQVSNSYGGYVGYNAGATGVATVIGPGSTWAINSELQVGKSGSGTLTVGAGGQVSNSMGVLGGAFGATGAATITGAGSMWTNGGTLYVADYGTGTLTVEAGGQVSNSLSGYLGYGSATAGVATIRGSGSKWINSSTLYVGYSGTGTLQVGDGGSVSANTVSVNSKSLLAIDASNGSLLTVRGGTGTITNNGKIRILAGAGPAAGLLYAPIAATTWTGTGTYTAIGGTWNAATHKFTVSPPVNGDSGISVALDLATQQRVLVSYSPSDWSVGASLPAKAGTVSFTAQAMQDSDLAPLTPLLNPDESILGAWQFAVSGSAYTAGDPFYLSFPVRMGLMRDDLHLWQRNGTVWSSLAPSDLNVSQGYANFTTTNLGSYAVSAVPEPSTLALLSAAAVGLLVCHLRRQKARPSSTARGDNGPAVVSARPPSECWPR